MKTTTLCIDTIEKVRRFVNIISKLDGDFDLQSGRFIVDAKSIMGIFSLDLAKPLVLRVHIEEIFDDVCAELSEFIL